MTGRWEGKGLLQHGRRLRGFSHSSEPCVWLFIEERPWMADDRPSRNEQGFRVKR